MPAAASAASSSASVTPACTRTCSRPISTIRFIRDVLRSVSPIGVAPPVSDDWAPIGRIVRAHRSASATSASVAARISPSRCPPGKCEASSRCGAISSASRLTRADGGPPRGRRVRMTEVAMTRDTILETCELCFYGFVDSALISRYWNSTSSKYCFTPTRSSRPCSRLSSISTNTPSMP